MISLLLGFGLFMVIGTAVALFAAWRAPVGYEDEGGFHFGPDEATQPEPVKDLHGVMPAFSR